MRRFAPFFWLAGGAYFVVAAAADGAGIRAAMALVCAFIAGLDWSSRPNAT